MAAGTLTLSQTQGAEAPWGNLEKSREEEAEERKTGAQEIAVT